MRHRLLFVLSISGAAALAACSSNSSAPLAPTSPPSATPTVAATVTPAPTATPTAAPTATPTPTAAPSAQPQVIHVGFGHAGTVDPTYGPVYYYSLTTGAAQVLTFKTGSSVVFTNDGAGAPHTASGFGGAFPTAFNNTNGRNAGGTTIDGGTTWSTGTLAPGATSSVFSIGAPGTYYFGCAFHYTTVPTASNNSMGDVIVSTN